MIYTLYTIWKCLQVKDGNDYKYGLCEFVLAGCCLPCYLFWRTFVRPCELAPKVAQTPIVTQSSINSQTQ